MKYKKTILLVLFLQVFFDYNLHAVSYVLNTSGVYLGVRGSRIYWSDCCDKFSGYSIGPCVGIDYRKPSNVYGGFRFDWMLGSLHHTMPKEGYKNFDLQGRLGYTFGQTFLFTPYSGLGLNIIKTKLPHKKNPCNTHLYNAVYVPVGVIMTYHPSSTLSYGFDYQFNPQIDAYVTLSGFKNIAFSLKLKGQHNIEFPIQFTYPQQRFYNFQYRIVPFYRTYTYGATHIVCKGNCSPSTFNLTEKRVHEWGVKYEVAIW